MADYRLSSGDRVRVTVFNEPDLSGETTLDGLGRFAMPLAGEIDALGLTTQETARRIEARLSEQELLRSPAANVEILTYRPYFILGEVRQPGSYPYQAGATVVRAVAEAGGFTYRADRDAIALRRGEGDEARYRAELTTPILPGDIIEVEERLF